MSEPKPYAKTGSPASENLVLAGEGNGIPAPLLVVMPVLHDRHPIDLGGLPTSGVPGHFLKAEDPNFRASC